MPAPSHFIQECPTCGRDLRIRLAYRGRKVFCQHCKARFTACEPTSPEYPPSDSGLFLLKRAEELLAVAAVQSGSWRRRVESAGAESHGSDPSSEWAI